MNSGLRNGDKTIYGMIDRVGGAGHPVSHQILSGTRGVKADGPRPVGTIGDTVVALECILLPCAHSVFGQPTLVDTWSSCNSNLRDWHEHSLARKCLTQNSC